MEFAFPETITAEQAGTIPEQFKGFYKTGQDGSFALDKDNPIVGTSVHTILGMAGALRAARAEAKAHKGKAVDLSALADFGETPEGIAENVKAKITELSEQLANKGTVDIKKIEGDLSKRFTTQLTEKDTVIQGLTGQLTNYLVDNAALSAIAEHKGMAELLMPFIKQQVKVSQEGGKFVVNVVDANGDIRYSGRTSGPMSIAELVGEMKSNAKYGALFESDRQAGDGGSGAQQRQQQRQTGAGQVTLSPEQKIALGLSKGTSSALKQRR